MRAWRWVIGAGVLGMALALCPWRGTSGERPVAGHILSLLVSKQRDDASVPAPKKELSVLSTGLSLVQQEPKWVTLGMGDGGGFLNSGQLASLDLPPFTETTETGEKEITVLSTSGAAQKNAFPTTVRFSDRTAFMTLPPVHQMPAEQTRKPESHPLPDATKEFRRPDGPGTKPMESRKENDRVAGGRRTVNEGGAELRGVRVDAGPPPKAMFLTEIRSARAEQEDRDRIVPSKGSREKGTDKQPVGSLDRVINRTVKGLASRIWGD